MLARKTAFWGMENSLSRQKNPTQKQKKSILLGHSVLLRALEQARRASCHASPWLPEGFSNQEKPGLRENRDMLLFAKSTACLDGLFHEKLSQRRRALQPGQNLHPKITSQAAGATVPSLGAIHRRVSKPAPNTVPGPPSPIHFLPALGLGRAKPAPCFWNTFSGSSAGTAGPGPPLPPPGSIHPTHPCLPPRSAFPPQLPARGAWEQLT